MAQFYLGQIIQGGWNFAPSGTHMCDGSILAISQYSALFALLGTTYGGNGVQNFALPDLRGRSMLGAGQGPGLSNYVLGEVSGSEHTTILTSNLPAHTHTASFSSTSTMSAATTRSSLQQSAVGSVLGRSNDGATNPTSIPEIYCPAGTATPNAMGGLNVAGTVTVNPTGSGIPISILDPFLVITQVIMLVGIFPSRN